MVLRPLPSGYEHVNRVWLWAALLTLSLSALLQALVGLDWRHRACGNRLRRELLCVPGGGGDHRPQVETAPGASPRAAAPRLPTAALTPSAWLTLPPP